MRLGKALATGIAEEAPREAETARAEREPEDAAVVVEPLPEPVEAPGVR
ncbi:hypothetical protein [Streptomyces sp. SGAir0957]